MTKTRRERSPDAPAFIIWPAGVRLWRVSRDDTGLAFSSSARSYRFSPMRDQTGDIVPAWYGAMTEAGALFESVFHDIRPPHRAPRVLPNQYADRVLAPVVTVRPITLVDLTSSGLHAIGITRTRLIGPTSRRYDWTNEVASRLRAAAPTADGFLWVSRARDTSQCVVLYADAGRAPMLTVAPAPAGPVPLNIGSGLALLRELATPARITIVVADP